MLEGKAAGGDAITASAARSNTLLTLGQLEFIARRFERAAHWSTLKHDQRDDLKRPAANMVIANKRTVKSSKRGIDSTLGNAYCISANAPVTCENVPLATLTVNNCPVFETKKYRLPTGSKAAAGLAYPVTPVSVMSVAVPVAGSME